MKRKFWLFWRWIGTPVVVPRKMKMTALCSM
jgi:hypothetical protein